MGFLAPLLAMPRLAGSAFADGGPVMKHSGTVVGVHHGRGTIEARP